MIVQKVILILLVTSTAICSSTKASKDNVVMMVEMIRHGARAPLVRVKDEQWITNTGNGELSETGKRMEYYLGLNTKHRYPKFFSKPLKHNEYWLRSTQLNRTLMSAVSHSLGLTERFIQNITLEFPNDDIRLLPPQMRTGALFNISEFADFSTPLPFGFRPFPVYTEFPVDEYLRMNGCKGLLRDTVESFAATSVLLEKTKFFPELYQWVLAKYGLSNETFNPKTANGDNEFVKAQYLADFAIMDNLNNPSPTIEPSDPKYGYLEDIYALSLFQRFNRTKAMKSMVTPPLTQIRTYFQNKINGMGNGSYPLRYVLFSAHDTTISSHLVGMNPEVVNTTCLITSLSTGKRDPNCSIYPPVGSNIIWELVQNDTVFFIKVSYNGVYLDYCNNNKKDGYGDFYCTVEEFDQTINGKINQDYKTYCGYEIPAGGDWVSFGLIGVLFLYSIFITVTCMRRRREVDKTRRDALSGGGYQNSPEKSNVSQGVELDEM